MTLADTPHTTPLDAARRVVIKVGSALLIGEDGAARDARFKSFADDVDALRRDRKDVVLVSSGAVALGRGVLGLGEGPLKLEEKQAAAAAGQARLMRAFDAAFAPHKIATAQALLTSDDTENRRRWLNARATLETLLDKGATPIVNENDTVATEEIRYGDNDRLAARVAQMIGADVLVLLSDVDGLYTGDPQSSSEAKHIPEVHALTPDIMAMAGGANKHAGYGSGGMATKLEAARIALTAGCATAITLGTQERPVSALANGARATWFIPDLSPETARRQWLAGTLNPSGEIYVDAGAAKALRGGKSLLHAGVKAISGGFERGDAVAVIDPDGETLGHGISAYSALDAEKLIGRQSSDIEPILGYRGRPALIHRDDLALTASVSHNPSLSSASGADVS